jgi:hypothetical protein
MPEAHGMLSLSPCRGSGGLDLAASGRGTGEEAVGHGCGPRSEFKNDRCVALETITPGSNTVAVDQDW